MNHYDDTPETAVFLPLLPERFGTGLGYGRCGCSPTDGQSCRVCDGTESEERELRRDPALWAAAVEWTYGKWAAEQRERAARPDETEAA